MKPYWNKSIAAWLVLLLALSPLFVLPQTGHASAGIPSAGFGKALEFDGFSTFVELNNPIAAGSAFTEEVWLYPPSSGGYQGVLGYQALYGLSNSRSPSLYVYDQTGLHGGYADDDGNFLYWQVPNVLTVGVWNHVAVTFDGTRYKAYVNGDQVYDSDTDDNGFVYASHAPSSSYPITWIGKVDKVFNGGIDEVRIWDTALTPTEIQAWINRGLTADHPEYAHLKGYWQFNQGTGSTLTGAVGGDGTLINSPTWVDADIHVKYEVGQQGGSTTVQLFGYDDVGTPLTQAIVSAPSHGTLLENGNGEWTYTHSGDGSTSDSFTYKVNNGTSDSGNVATVELVIPPSSNADLSGLALSSGTLNEPFASGTTSYTANVANGVSSVTVTAAVYDSNATLQVNGVPMTSGVASGAISLNVGDTAIPVVVTAQDGTTTKTYTVTVTRAGLSGNADLNGLALSSGPLNEPFASGTTSYTANVANGVSSVTVTAAVYDSNATLQVNDVPTTSGAASEAISLSVGDTAIPIVVTAQDGTMKTYTITVNKLYTLTYDSNDSTSGSAPSPVSQYYNTTVAVSGNTGNLARTGYTFAGWNAAADGSGATYAANDPLTLGSDVTLYAKWTINKVRYGSSSSGGTSGEAEQPTELPVIVDGKPQHQMATGSTVTENGQDSLTATLDAAQLSAQLAQEGDKPVVVVPIAANVGRVDAVLTGDAVKAMENKQATLEIQTLKGSYKLPMAEVAIDQVSNRLGANVKLADIVVHVGIAQSDAAAAQLLDTAADQGEFTVVLPPVDFTISASFNGKTVSVDQFSSYVQREIPLPEDAVPDQITTAIALNADGTTRHVPTYLISRDGSYYAIVNSLTNSTYALIWHPMTFADVEGHWSQDAVNDMASRLIVNGVDATHYQPDAAITRAEFAAIVVRALGLAANGQAAVFRDVKSDDWYAGAAAKAQEYGLIEGYADGTFRPGQRITREEATVMMARAMQLTGLNTSLDNAAMDDLLAAFEDGAEVSAWAKPAVAAAVERGVIAGSGNKLLPSLPITRAETAAIVQRMLIEAKLINNG